MAIIGKQIVMADIVAANTRSMQLAKKIDEQVLKICSAAPLKLPDAQHPIVAHCVVLIEKHYAGVRTKMEIDHAVDLLHIAFSAMPQSMSAIRNRIEPCLTQLFKSQTMSELAMRRATHGAERVMRWFKDLHWDWLDIKESTESLEGFDRFFEKDLGRISRHVQRMASDINEELMKVAGSYDALICDMVVVTELSTKTLTDRAAVEAGLAASRVDRDRLDFLAEDLGGAVRAFDAWARDGLRGAATAEERAVVLHGVTSGAGMVAAAVPPVARTAGREGPSFLAASAMTPLAAPGSTDQAETPRTLLMKILDKAEACETERRSQTAALAELIGLLRSKRSEEETVTLALMSLDRSVDAIRRTRDIIADLTWLFESLVAVAEVATMTIEIRRALSEQAARDGTRSRQDLVQLVQLTDEFFIRQVADWQAVQIVSQDIMSGFESGYVRINRLNGRYYTGDDLRKYYADSADRLSVLVREREMTGDAGVAEIRDCRDLLMQGVPAGA